MGQAKQRGTFEQRYAAAVKPTPPAPPVTTPETPETSTKPDGAWRASYRHSGMIMAMLALASMGGGRGWRP